MRNGKIQSPTESTYLNQLPKNLSQVITSATPMTKLSMKYNQIFNIYLYPFMELTDRSDPTTNFQLSGSNEVDSHIGVPFGSFTDITSHLRGKIP